MTRPLLGYQILASLKTKRHGVRRLRSEHHDEGGTIEATRTRWRAAAHHALQSG